jgi:5' nucleotidase, deoxy (Pyrimidine), cytosolic type C protein (NT5C)
VSLRIAFDLDGVLADMEAGLGLQSAELFVQGFEDEGSSADAPTHPRLSLRQLRRLWRHVKSIEDFWESLAETEPGVVARLAALAEEKRWEVIFLTKRPQTAGRTSQLQSQRWLESKGFVLPSVYVVHGSRGRIAAALGLDVVVDDRPENCFDVVSDSNARAVLVWRRDEAPPAAAQRLGISVVSSVCECLDSLSTPRDGRGRRALVDWVLKALGAR